jgi:hypothetical protein
LALVVQLVVVEVVLLVPLMMLTKEAVPHSTAYHQLAAVKVEWVNLGFLVLMQAEAVQAAAAVELIQVIIIMGPAVQELLDKETMVLLDKQHPKQVALVEVKVLLEVV